MGFESGGKKRGRVPEYICHRHRASATCTNALKISVTEMNEAVLQTIEAHALTPEAIEHVIQMTERDDVREQQVSLKQERKELERQIANIARALAEDAGLPSLIRKLRELEDRLVAIDAEIAGLRPLPRLAPGREGPCYNAFCAGASPSPRALWLEGRRAMTSLARRASIGCLPASSTSSRHGCSSRLAMRRAWSRSARRIPSMPTTGACSKTRRSIGAPGGDRTPGLQVRSLSLYPAELRAQSWRKR
jgi:hypothetical protein